MPRILKLFISYAHEDAKIAIAVSNALHCALGDTLAEVFLDKTSLEAGFDFKAQIEDRLENTDVLIIIFTGVEKPSHGYTGWEVGYFRGVQRREAVALGNSRKKVISLYLNSPPGPVSGVHGVSFGITRETLSLTEAEFAGQLEVTDEHPMVMLVDGLEEELAAIKREGGFPRGQTADTRACVRELLTAVFAHLKTTVDRTLKPQKQITIRTTLAALDQADGNLPPSAMLMPVGSGSPMAIFGLPETELSWESFVAKTADHRMGAGWRDAINSVVSSSLSNQIDVDNSQIIFSTDGVKLYRLILTTGTTYFNGNQEFNIYLVEALRPTDYGNHDTTLLLKGLGMVCRFRFLFLEENSEFHCNNVLAVAIERIPGLARRMVRELNLLMRDAREAGLDQPNVWANFVDWNLILEMSKHWAVLDKQLRQTAASILGQAAQSDRLEPLRTEFADTLKEMDSKILTLNGTLIEQMLERLKQLVKR